MLLFGIGFALTNSPSPEWLPQWLTIYHPREKDHQNAEGQSDKDAPRQGAIPPEHFLGTLHENPGDCYQGEGHGECAARIVQDGISRFYLWLVAAAVFQATATIGTVALLRRHAVLLREQTRAFVFGKGFQIGHSLWDGALREFVFCVQYENVGNTPATDIRNWIEFRTHPMNEDRVITFTPNAVAGPTVVGPRGAFQSGFITISLDVILENWHRETEVLLWSRIEYRDTLRPAILHHHEQSVRLELMHDPSELPPPNHPFASYIVPLIYGPQNSVG
jgi:hypothetical protein